MKNQIHHQNWNLQTGQQILQLFIENFEAATIKPNINIVNQLKALESATLEILENRTASTIYRIRQTGTVYQLCQPNGDLFEFEDFEDYQAAEPIDELIEAYQTKPLKFTVADIDGDLIVTHHQPPPFTARWVGGETGVEDVQFTNGEPSQKEMLSLAKILRKLGAFMVSYFRNRS